MSKKAKITCLALIAAAVIAVLVWYLHRTSIPVLEPRGTIGLKERNLMVFTVALGMVVIIPVFVMTTVIAWKYRESNTKAPYRPDWDRQRAAEIAWWGIPIIIIGILSVVTWVSTYALNPYKPLASRTPTVNIQVVALDWKWLFIYPAQHIASVNLAEFPVDTPVHFEITSDTVMNSFWVPQLGSQIYAMPGMSTQLNLIATQLGDYRGSSANISGSGFAGMTFTARASTTAGFKAWVQSVKHRGRPLSLAAYNRLAQPSKNNPVATYAPVQTDLYDGIVTKYMTPASAAGGQGALAP